MTKSYVPVVPAAKIQGQKVKDIVGTALYHFDNTEPAHVQMGQVVAEFRQQAQQQGGDAVLSVMRTQNDQMQSTVFIGAIATLEPAKP